MPVTTWNPSDKSEKITLSNGNLTAQINKVSSAKVRATHGLFQSGKGYFELVVGTASLDCWNGGVATLGETLDSIVGDSVNGWGFQAYYSATKGMRYHNSYSQYGAPIPNGGIFQCAVDAVAGKLWFGGDGVWFESGNPETGENPAYSDVFAPVYPAWSGYQTANIAIARFAASALSYTPPAGFSAWDEVASDIAPTAILSGPSLWADIEDSGAYRITGTVDELGVAGRYRVRLFDRISGRLVRETWSAADGTYSFLNIAYRDRGYFVIAYDHDEPLHNAAIADLMTPEAMP